MKTLEKIFFKNRALFKNVVTFNNILSFSNMENIYNPGYYSLDFLKEKVKPFCYYLFSFLGEPRTLFVRICVNDLENNNRSFFDRGKIIIVEIEYLDIRDSFLQEIEECFNEQKRNFCYKIPSKPFSINIEEIGTIIFNHQLQLNLIINSQDNEEDSEYSEGEEIEEEIKQINTKQTFKSVECVICLTNTPNVLFCNCGHLCVCIECDKVKSLNTCPVCKTETTIKRDIEY